MANLNKKYLANSDQISVNFSESQLKPAISLSDLNREYNFLLDLNWLARKTPKKMTYFPYIIDSKTWNHGYVKKDCYLTKNIDFIALHTQ